MQRPHWVIHNFSAKLLFLRTASKFVIRLQNWPKVLVLSCILSTPLLLRRFCFCCCLFPLHTQTCILKVQQCSRSFWLTGKKVRHIYVWFSARLFEKRGTIYNVKSTHPRKTTIFVRPAAINFNLNILTQSLGCLPVHELERLILCDTKLLTSRHCDATYAERLKMNTPFPSDVCTNSVGWHPDGLLMLWWSRARLHVLH